MTTVELKSNLRKLVAETDDSGVLRKIEAYFTTLKSKKIGWWDTISSNEKKQLKKKYIN